MVPFVHETKGVLTNFIILYINYTPKVEVCCCLKHDFYQYIKNNY